LKGCIVLPKYPPPFWYGAFEHIYQLNKLLDFDFVVHPSLDYDIWIVVDEAFINIENRPKQLVYVLTYPNIQLLDHIRYEPDILLTPSELMVEKIQKKLPSTHVLYLPPLIDVHELQKFCTFRKDKHRICFIGNIYKQDYKNVRLIPKLIRKFPIDFFIIGRGVSRIMSSSLPNVYVFDYITRPYAFLNQSTIVVIPSKQDLNPLTAYHALYFGCHVIATPIYQLKQEVPFIHFTTEERIIEAIEECLETKPSFINEYHEYVKKYGITDFDISFIFNQIS